MLCLKYYQLANSQPPIEKWADAAPSVRQANEFGKQAAAEKEVSRLRAELYSLADVGFVRLNINMEFSQYDASLGEYTLRGFGADNYLQYSCFADKQLRVRLDNSPWAQSWPLKPAEAEQVLQRNGGSRSIVAVSRIELVGAEPDSQQGPLVLIGKLREVTILGVTNVRLGSVVVPDK
jgi:hypothetical protein